MPERRRKEKSAMRLILRFSIVEEEVGVGLDEERFGDDGRIWFVDDVRRRW